MKFGVKVVDKSSTKNKKRLNKFLSFYEQLDGNELAIYNDSDEYIKNINYHILHTQTYLFSIEKFLYDKTTLVDYISNSLLPILKKENINNIVIHLLPGKGVDYYSNVQINEFVQFCVDFSISEKINIFLENTFDQVIDMERYFSMDKNNILNFCFDIGHAKSLTIGDDFSDWITFIKNFPNDIHVHFHTNRGIEDEHLPVTSKTNLFTSDFHQGLDYIQMGNQIVEEIYYRKNSSFILETHNDYMKNNISYLNKINRFKKFK